MPIRLVSLDNGPSILLDKPILLLGRHQECDVQIESRKISRRHCCIAQVDGSILIRDLDSTNGIQVNGTRVREAPLAIGDEVVIGNLRYRVVSDSPSRITPEPASRPVPEREPDRKARADRDALIESGDLPVSLDESMVSEPDPGPAQTLDVDDSAETHQARSPILPGDLNLAPSSSSHPIVPPPSP